MKKLFALPLMAVVCHAQAVNPIEDFKHFEVISTQVVDDDKAVQFLADVAGAVRIDWDFRPTDDKDTPLYEFKNLAFLQNGERHLGSLASNTIVNCHDKTSLQGFVWYVPADETPPMMMPPKSFDFMPIKETDAFYLVAQRLCQWQK